jgi:hypothetical protein
VTFPRVFFLSLILGVCCVGCAQNVKLNVPREKLTCKVHAFSEPRLMSERGTKLLSDLLNEITPENGYRESRFLADRRQPGAAIRLSFRRSAPDPESEVVHVRVWVDLGGAVGFTEGNYITVGAEKVEEICKIIQQHSVRKPGGW